MYDICVIGGGPAGMAASIAAAQENSHLSILIVEKKDTLGKKLKATGNGRCNITNTSCTNYQAVASFLDQIGIATKIEGNGWVYPMSEQAGDVVTALVDKIKQYNIEVMVNHPVLSITYDENSNIFSIDGKLMAKNLLIACGGKAAPVFGTTGDGFKLAKSFGHQVSRVIPVLTPLMAENLMNLKGVRVKAKASLLCRGEVMAVERGEVQFTGEGISGISVFNLSSFVKLTGDVHFKDYHVVLDFMEDWTLDQVRDFLIKRRANGNQLLTTVLPKKLGSHIADLTENIDEISRMLKDFHIQISGAAGWNQAQCTGGGVLLDEVDNQTMESKILKNLYFAGEVLDYNGPCGGFNLQFAWETGIKAGKAMGNVQNTSD